MTTILFKSHSGSHLYGTTRPESDEDFQGIFCPSLVQFMGMQNPPSEFSEDVKLSDGERNTKGDIDCKYFSLKRFLQLASSGQPGQLEMLFSPRALVTSETWETIVENRSLFLSRKSLAPFVGFALEQSRKARIKGENLVQIRALIEAGRKLADKQRGYHFYKHLVHDGVAFDHKTQSDGPKFETGSMPKVTTFGGVELKFFKNEFNAWLVEIAGRKYDVGTITKTFLENMEILETKYGTRSQAAAAEGQDFKSLMHCYRLLAQGRELMRDGRMTLPRPQSEVDFLLKIRRGDYIADYHTEIEEQLTELRALQAVSPLPPEVDHAKVNELCLDLHFKLFDLPAKHRET